MCRLAGLVASLSASAPPLSELLYDAPHSLQRQSYAPRAQHHGKVNVDGTGIAWWADDAPEPLRFVIDRPAWMDGNLPFLAPRLHGRTQVAAVRDASQGIPQGAAFVAPFTYNRLALAHNGWIGDFRTVTGRPLIARLSDKLYSAYHGASDSLAILLTVVAALERDPAAGLAAAVRAAVVEVAHLCREHGSAATLNLLVGDGERLVAVRASVDAPFNTLSVLRDGARLPGVALVASEPLDDDAGWLDVPPASLVELTSNDLTITAIPDLPLAEVSP